VTPRPHSNLAITSDYFSDIYGIFLAFPQENRLSSPITTQSKQNKQDSICKTVMVNHVNLNIEDKKPGS
jgi:hypothetical protein